MKTYTIYEIKCNDADVEFNYVGHTTNFRNRKYAHKQNCNHDNCKHYNYKIYQYIRENGGWENWSMSPLEEYECETPIQARIQEQYWIDLKESKLNSKRAHTTAEEEKEKEKQYRNINKNKIRHYQIDNKEHIAERCKQYRINNKEAIQNKLKQKIVCECGINTTQSHKSRHIKSKQHLELMSKLNL